MFAAHPMPGLSVRLLEERHAELVFRRIDEQRDHLRPWLPWVDATREPDDTLQFIRGALELFASRGEIAAGIWHDGLFCGSIGTHRLDPLNRVVEIGYWLAREYQGRGIMTATCRVLVEHCLLEMDLNRIEIRCSPENKRSGAIPARLGFTLDATLREAQYLHGNYFDLQLWSMLRRDWRK